MSAFPGTEVAASSQQFSVGSLGCCFVCQRMNPSCTLGTLLLWARVGVGALWSVGGQWCNVLLMSLRLASGWLSSHMENLGERGAIQLG